MKSTYYRGYVYHVVLSVACALLYLWQNSVNAFPEISGLRAVPVIPFVICISMFNPKTAGMVYGLFAGMIMDVTWSKISGFNALCLFIICVVCSLLIRFLFNCRISSAMLLSGLACLVYFLVYWLCFCKFAGVEESAYCLFSRYLPMALYTWAFTLPFYYFVEFLTKKLQSD